MKNQSKKNLSFNFKPEERAAKGEVEHQNLIKLFNCFKCGFHSKAISKFYIKGFENDFIIQLISLHPEKPQKTIDLDSRKLMNEGELIEEVTCGICGKPGTIESVPGELLQAFGFNVLRDTKVDSDKKTSAKKSIK